MAITFVSKRAVCAGFKFLFFWGGGGLSFALNCKKRFRRGRSFGFELLQMVLCVCCKKCAEIPYWTFCFVCPICLLMVWFCFPNLLAYDLALFSEFALLRSQIWKRDSFALVVRNSAMQINRFTKIVIFVSSLGFTFFSCIALLGIF